MGTPRPAVRIFNAREVDEMFILDIDATRERRGPNLSVIEDLAEECYMPLTVGGGIRTPEDIQKLLRAGADKVSINSEGIQRPQFITESARIFGSQCVVASIDVRRHENKTYEVFSQSGKVSTGLDPIDWARRVEDLGAGEILVTSIDRDGTMEGYDVDLIGRVTESVTIPVIACGGAGKLEDFVSAVKVGRASAVAAASIYHYTQVTPMNVKTYMHQAGIDVRL